MEIDETRWRNLQALASVSDRGAPKLVVVALGSLIGHSSKLVVWPSMDTTVSTTTWSCWVVTERSLGRLKIEYEKPL
jgi:hypothetical protein